VKPFFCYFGGKWRSTPLYPKPQFDTIVEPFAGAAGYSTRHWERNVVLVEKDATVAALWRWLIRVPARDVAALPLVIEHTDLLDVCAEAKSLIGFWLNKGTTAPSKSPSRWMRDGIRPKSMWGPEIRDRIARQVDMIRHWVIIEGDYSMAPDVDATWFVDPPYYRSGKHYRRSSVDYTALSAWCKSRRGQVMVCEQEGADWLPFRTHATTKGLEGKNGGKASKEVIWTNYQENAER